MLDKEKSRFGGQEEETKEQDKYKSRRPSDILGENGLLVHMAPPFGLRRWGDEKDNGNYGHVSCSIINARDPHVLDTRVSPVGYILEDIDTPVQCVFPSDGGTVGSTMLDSEWSGCACLGDNPFKVSPDVWTCMWPSTSLEGMMQASAMPL